MRTSTKYILKFHILPFIFGTVIVVFLFLFQLLRRDLDKLIGKGLEYDVILQYFVLNLSWMLVLAIPMGVLFSTLTTFGNLSSTFEITAFKSGGYSFLQLSSPVVIASILITAFLFWFNDRVLPEANHQAKILLFDINRKKPTFSLESGQFSTQIENYTILARSVDSLSNGLKGVTIYDNSQSPYYRTINSDSAYVYLVPQINKLCLTLFKGNVVQMLNLETQNLRVISFDSLVLFLDAKGFFLERTPEGMLARSDREMNVKDMMQIVHESKTLSTMLQEKLEKFLTTPPRELKNRKLTEIDEKEIENIVQRDLNYLESQMSIETYRIFDYEQKSRQYEVEIHKKFAIPFACLIFALIGCPLGFLTKRGNFGISASISLGFYIFYWICLIGGEKLADRGFISPFISMWIGNFIILIFSILLFVKANNESKALFGFLTKINLFKK